MYPPTFESPTHGHFVFSPFGAEFSSVRCQPQDESRQSGWQNRSEKSYSYVQGNQTFWNSSGQQRGCWFLVHVLVLAGPRRVDQVPSLSGRTISRAGRRSLLHLHLQSSCSVSASTATASATILGLGAYRQGEKNGQVARGLFFPAFILI